MRFAFKTANEHNSWAEIRSVWVEADGIDLYDPVECDRSEQSLRPRYPRHRGVTKIVRQSPGGRKKLPYACLEQMQICEASNVLGQG